VIEQAAYTNHGAYVRCVTEVVNQARRAGDLRGSLASGIVRKAARSSVAQARVARTLLPGPGENGFDPELADLDAQYDRQFHTFHAAPFGMSLDVHVDLDADEERALISDFMADPAHGSGPEAFQEFSGKDVFDVVDHYSEVGDLGMFGGLTAAGDAFRYASLRDACTRPPCPEVETARSRVIQLLEVLHVAHAITGENGVVVRGLFRRGMPRRGGDPETIPLFDSNGNPNPPCSAKPENPTFAPFEQRLRFREDATQTVPGDPASGRFPDWIWMDNASKDQLTGWVYARGAVWDVVRTDPSIPDELKLRLQADATRMARRLMRVAGPVGLDLSIIDGDGCATTFHDVNPEELEGAGLRAGPPPTPVLTGAARTLTAFDAPPYWNVSRNNCDAGELAAGACIGLDGTLIEIAPVPGRGGAIVAVRPVPRGIRPPSNFEWRSNPYSVNGGGGDRLNPGGDFRGAYWLGRFLVRGQDGSINLAQGARGR
jgi:hypothetical protein